MIPPIVIAEVARLLREGTRTVATIARLAGVSTTTVRDVRSGKRAVAPVPADAEWPASLEVPRRRCPECGAPSRIPPNRCACFACQIRGSERQRIYDLEGSADDLALDLKPGHDERYEVVRHSSAEK